MLFRMFDETVNELRMVENKGSKLLEYILERFPPIDSSGLVMGEANLWLTTYWTGLIL
jgi:hypothetical protein